MSPQDFLRLVVRPNCAEAIGAPQSMRYATNAIFALDGLVGIAYWYLYDAGHASATAFNDDSPYKAHLAQTSIEYKIIKDAAFALKHGRLTHNKKVPPLVKRASDVKAETHGLSTGFILDRSHLDGEPVRVSLDAGDREAAPLIAAVLAFMETYVAGLP